MMTNIPGIEGAVYLNGWGIGATPTGDEAQGVAGTLYNGDADLISDFLADPDGELNVHGVLHHINVKFTDDVYTLTVSTCGRDATARFGHREAFDLVLALAGVQTHYSNPTR